MDLTYAGDLEDRKSRSGAEAVVFYGGVSVEWRNPKQKCVALSSTEAEYVAAGVIDHQIPQYRSENCVLTLFYTQTVLKEPPPSEVREIPGELMLTGFVVDLICRSEMVFMCLWEYDFAYDDYRFE